MAADTDLVIALRAQNNKLQADLQRANRRISSFRKKGESDLQKLGKVFVAVFAAGKIQQIGREIFNVTAEFQKMEAVLTNTLGSSSEAQAAMEMITKFASQTPFQVNQLTGAFVKLANQGFIPTAEEMRKLGDLAASTGKDFDQLAEAVIDAQTGEFERLKEFGIRAEKQGDKVTFTFKEAKKQVDFTSDSIQQYILSLGEAEGVSGAMAAISGTLSGKLSNLQDNVDQLYLAIGSSDGGLVASLLDAASAMVRFSTDTVKGNVSLKDFLLVMLRSSGGAIGFFINQLDRLGEKIGMDLIPDLEDLRKRKTTDWKNALWDKQEAEKGVEEQIKSLGGVAKNAFKDFRADILNSLSTQGEFQQTATEKLIGIPSPEQMRDAFNTYKEGYLDQLADLHGDIRESPEFKALAEVNQALISSIKEVGMAALEGLGASLATGDIENALNNILLVFANGLSQLGKALIGYGLVMKGVNTSLLNPFSWGTALAAGAAAIVAAGALKAAVGNTSGGMRSGLGGGSSGGFSGSNVGGQSITINVSGAVKGNDLGFLVRNDNRLGQRQRL